MKTILTIVTLSLWPTLLISQATLPDYGSTSTYGGTVEDENGTPLHGVVVEFNHASRPYRAETNASGRFFFSGIGTEVDRGAKYEFSFRKPGFYPLDTTRLINDPGRIILRPAPCGYLLIKDAETNKVLAGIEIGANDKSITCSQSDRFGFSEVKFPGKYEGGKLIIITVKGEIDYQDGEISVTTRDLKSKIIEVRLRPTRKSYKEVLNTLQDAHRRLAEADPTPGTEKEFLRYFNYLQHKNLNKKDQDDWNNKQFFYARTVELILNIEKVEAITMDRTKKKVRFEEKMEQIARANTPLKKLQGCDELFELGIRILEDDLNYSRKTEQWQTFKDDAEFLKSLLQQEEAFIRASTTNLDEAQRRAALENVEIKLKKLMSKIP